MDIPFKLQYDCVTFVVTARFIGSMTVLKVIVYVYCNTGTVKRSVNVNVELNQHVGQQYSRTMSGMALNFQRLGQLLQEVAIICWLDLTGGYYR